MAPAGTKTNERDHHSFGKIDHRLRIIRFSWITHARPFLAIILIAAASSAFLFYALTQTSYFHLAAPARMVRAPLLRTKVAAKDGRLRSETSVYDRMADTDVVEPSDDGTLARYVYKHLAAADTGAAEKPLSFQDETSRPRPDPFSALLPRKPAVAAPSALPSVGLRNRGGRLPVIVPINVSQAVEEPAAARYERLVAFLRDDERIDDILGASGVVEADRLAFSDAVKAHPAATHNRIELLLEKSGDATSRRLLMARLTRDEATDIVYAREDSGHFRPISDLKLFQRLAREAMVREPARTEKGKTVETERQDPGIDVSQPATSRLVKLGLSADNAAEIVKLTENNGIQLTDQPVDLLLRVNAEGQSEPVSVTIHDKEGPRRFYRYRPSPDQEAEFFDEQGRSVSRVLMKKPVPNGRLGDGFAWRVHPILNVRKHHDGVDYAAPYGSPILAAGDGEIVMISYEPGYGKYIRLKHDGGYYTTYAHISGTPSSLRVGQRVSQGQVIAYVGSTGLSTGPHLYYELRADGQYLDPRSTRLPAGTDLHGENMNDFEAEIGRMQQIERYVTTLPSDRLRE